MAFLGIESPTSESLRALACSFYAYHAVKFRASEFTSSLPPFNEAPGTGFSVPYPFTHTVDADISCGIFLGAFRAAAMISGLLDHAPASMSYNETIPTEDLIGGCPAHTVQEAAG